MIYLYSQYKYMYTVAFVSQLPARLFQSQLGNFWNSGPVMNLSLWPLYLNVVFLWAIWVLTGFFCFFYYFLFILGYHLTFLYKKRKKKEEEVKASVCERVNSGWPCLGNTLYCLCDQTATFTTSSARHALGLVPPCGNTQGHTMVLSHHTLWQISVGALSLS